MRENPRSEDWMDSANCVGTDPEVWFPGKGGRASPPIRRVCEACDVTAECLSYAMQYNLRGIWGGLTESQRTTLRRSKPA